MSRTSGMTISMAKSVVVKPKKRGRPPTGSRHPVTSVRLPRILTRAIDAWAAKNGETSRSEAIRRLVELGLTVKPKGKVRG